MEQNKQTSAVSKRNCQNIVSILGGEGQRKGLACVCMCIVRSL